MSKLNVYTLLWEGVLGDRKDYRSALPALPIARQATAKPPTLASTASAVGEAGRPGACTPAGTDHGTEDRARQLTWHDSLAFPLQKRTNQKLSTSNQLCLGNCLDDRPCQR